MAMSTTQSSATLASAPASEWIRTFMIVQSATFLLAASFHFGVLIQGYADFRAAVPESLIASVLLAGLIATWIRPTVIRGIGLAVQGFALAGTFVGLFTIVIGIGPRTVLDIIIHATMVAELVAGLIVAYRARVNPARSPA